MQLLFAVFWTIDTESPVKLVDVFFKRWKKNIYQSTGKGHLDINSFTTQAVDSYEYKTSVSRA